MIRGTNAPFTFKLPYKENEIQWITIKFWQDGNPSFLPIKKQLEHCSFPNNPYELYVELTAAETMRFSDKVKAKVQLRAQATDGRTFGSHETLITVYPMNDEILDDDVVLPEEDDDGWVVLDGSTIS